MKRLRVAICALLLVAASTLVVSPPALAGVSPLTWAAPVRVDHQPPFSGNTIVGVSCPTSSFCVAVDINSDAITSSNPTGGPAAWTVTPIARNVLSGVSCPTAALCVAVDNIGNVITSTNPTGGSAAWTQANVDGLSGFTAVSCPSSSLCVAVDASGNVVTSTNPTGGAAAWTVTNVGGNLLSVSCSSANLCVAGDVAGDVVTSTNPTGGSAAWTVTHVDGTLALTGMSCPSDLLCVAVDNNGNVVTSSNPTGGAAAWTAAKIDGTNFLSGVSCGSLCAATDHNGNVVTSTIPTGGASTWHVANVDGSNVLHGVSCPSGLCVVGGDRFGNVVTSTNPTGGPGAWTVSNVDGSNGLNAMSCATNSLCVGDDNSGNVVTSTNPTGGATAWTVTHVGSFAVAGGGVSCAGTALCVVADSGGNVLTSTNPTGGAAAWTSTHVDIHVLSGISCPTTALCVATDRAGNVVTSTDPTGGATAWALASVDSGRLLWNVSCSSTSLCVAVDGNASDVLTSTNPTGGTGAWTVTHLNATSFIIGVSCVSSGLCVAVDGGGDVITSTNPTGGAGAWTVTPVDSTAGLNGVSCTSSNLCVATDGFGNVEVSSDPTGGAPAWTLTHVDGSSNGFLWGVSCPSSLLCVVADQATGSVITATGAGTPTLTSVASSQNPSFIGGGSVTYTATVSPVPDGGTVAFTDNSVTLSGCGAAAVSTSTGQATCTTTYSSSGTHSIVAGYSGDANFGPSSGGPLTQQVYSPCTTDALLPALANDAYGGYTTVIEIQNTASSPVNVDVAYFDSSGNLTGVGDSITNLPSHATWTVRQDNGHSFPSGGAGYGAVSCGGGQLATFVNEFAPAGGDATSYTGINPSVFSGPTLYAPAIARNAYGGYTTGIGLINESSVPSDITLTYRDSNGTVVKTQVLSGVAPGAYQALYSGDPALGLPDGFAGTATITSSAGQLNAIVNETGPGGQFSSYDALHIGRTTLYAPAALANAYGGYNTGMGIVNTTGTAGTVTITYYDSSGHPTIASHNIAANGYVGVYQPNDLTTPGAYTAQITSTVPVAAIVNETAPASNPGAQQSTAYNTFPTGSATLNLPLVESAGSDGWSTGEGIMNTGASTTTVTVTYYDTTTGAPIGTPDTLSLAPNAYWGLYQPLGGLPNGDRASAVVTTSGGQIAVICNESSGTSFMSYAGE